MEQGAHSKGFKTSCVNSLPARVGLETGSSCPRQGLGSFHTSGERLSGD